MSRLGLEVRVHKNFIEFVSDKAENLSAVKCNRIISRGNTYVCRLRLPKKIFYGINSFLISLPHDADVFLKQHGLHTKALAEEKWMDYFEIGGPIRGTLSLSLEIMNLRKGGELKIAIPPTNLHQKLVSFEASHPHRLLLEEDNQFALIKLPRMGSKKIIRVNLEYNLELHGCSLWNMCNSKECKLVKEKALVRDPLDDWGVYNRFLYELSSEKNAHSVLKKLLEFINGNIRYRSNPDRLGALYTLKMGIGACDEISDLAVRSLSLAGYKARFVKGFYIEDYNKLQGHAWVEILTDKGWLPFDPTGKILGIGMRWIKLLHEEKKKLKLIETSDALRLKSIKYSFN